MAGFQGRQYFRRSPMRIRTLRVMPDSDHRCGGISSASDVIEMMMAGASAVQIGTAVKDDPGIFRSIASISTRVMGSLPIPLWGAPMSEEPLQVDHHDNQGNPYGKDVLVYRDFLSGQASS